MAIFMDIKGTSQQVFQVGKNGARIRTGVSASNLGDITLQVRNAANSLSNAFQTGLLLIDSDSMIINSESAQSGADWRMIIARPTSGMTADVTLTLPIDAGTAGYLLSTDGAGVTSWVAPASAPTNTSFRDTTTLAFGSAINTALFTLPANAVVQRVEVIIDTAFDGVGVALQIGILGNNLKYMDSGDVDLSSGAGDRWVSNPNHAAVGVTEAIRTTYSAAGSTVGSARMIVDYCIPS